MHAGLSSAGTTMPGSAILLPAPVREAWPHARRDHARPPSSAAQDQDFGETPGLATGRLRRAWPTTPVAASVRIPNLCRVAGRLFLHSCENVGKSAQFARMQQSRTRSRLALHELRARVKI